MRLSPLLNRHASGVVLGVTQIINGLDNPVTTLSNYHYCYPQLVVKEVAFKFATSHFDRGVKSFNKATIFILSFYSQVRKESVRLLTNVIINYIEV